MLANVRPCGLMSMSDSRKYIGAGLCMTHTYVHSPHNNNSLRLKQQTEVAWACAYSGHQPL